MAGDSTREPGRSLPEVSPQSFVDLLALFVTLSRGRMVEWPPSYLSQIHAMALEAAQAAANALSGQLESDEEDPASP